MPVAQAVFDEFAGVFLQSGEIKIGNPRFADETHQQVSYHFSMRKQPFVAGVVGGHL